MYVHVCICCVVIIMYRAASPYSTISEANCHPFVFGRYFIHPHQHTHNTHTHIHTHIHTHYRTTHTTHDTRHTTHDTRHTRTRAHAHTTTTQISVDAQW